MNNNLDWLSLIEREWPLAPEWFIELRNQADQIFVRKANEDSKQKDLEQLANQLTSISLQQLRVTLGMQSAIIGRQFSLALESGAPPEEFFRLFEQLSRCGFDSPVAKARYVVILLIELEKSLPSAKMELLVASMKKQLEVCQIGCEENLQVLQTFLEKNDNAQDESSK